MSGHAGRNPRLDAISRYLSATWLGILLLAVAIIIAVRLLAMAFPSILDGLDVIEAGRTPNYFRNLFELLSFAGAFLVGITAILALVFAISQIREARNTRLATLYAALEGRWASPEMLKSKTAFYEISRAYEKAMAFHTPPKAPIPFEIFADQYLSKLLTNDYTEYSNVMSLVDFFEYIGMLEKSKYVDIDDIKYLLGSVCIEVYEIMSVHIEKLRALEAARLARNNLNNAPVQYFCFAQLVDEFKARFTST